MRSTSTSAPTAAQRRLVQAAYELTLRLDSFPAGSVLRCFASCTDSARADGVRPDDLASEVCRRAESVLRRRLRSSSPPVLPQEVLIRIPTQPSIRAAVRSG